MTYVYKTKMGGHTVVVEYVLSSVTNLLKIVDMTWGGEFHRLNWMSKDGQADLMDRIERDYLDNHSQWLGVTKDGQIMRQAVTF